MALWKRKQKKPKTEKGITVAQYKRKAIRTMGVAALSAVFAGFSLNHYHAEMARLNKQKMEWAAKDATHKEAEAKRHQKYEAEHRVAIEASKKKFYEHGRIAKLEPKLNVSSVLYADIPVQNRLSARTIHAELSRFNSPMASTNVLKVINNYSIKKGIDPAYILSVSRNETKHGTDTERSKRNKNPGNLKARSKRVRQDKDGFMIFGSWEEGTKAMINRLAGDTYIGGGHTTVKAIAHIYAPITENATNQYIHNITSVRNQLFKMQKKDNEAHRDRF